MAQDNDTSPNQERWLATKTIDHLKSDKAFVYPKSVVEAVSTIVIAVHDSYERNDNAIKYLSETVVKTLQQRPVADQYMQINRTDLAQKPLIVQLLILMQDIVIKQQLGQSVQQLVWLSIAMHTAALLIVSGRKTDTDTNNILMQFKMAQFSASSRRKWLWQALPNIAQTEISIKRILSEFNSLLEQKKSALEVLNNKQAAHTEEKKASKGKSNENAKYTEKIKKDKADAKAKLSQIEKITTAYQSAHALQKSKPKYKKPPKNIKIKAINLADNTSTFPLDSTTTNHNWNTAPNNDVWGSTCDDIEHSDTAVDLAFLDPNTEIYEGLTTSFEERIDHYEAPYLSYGEYPNPLTKNSIPLQTIDLSLQQNYMSQRDLALNSNTRLLSLAGCQALFAVLNQDASTLPESETHIIKPVQVFYCYL